MTRFSCHVFTVCTFVTFVFVCGAADVCIDPDQATFLQGSLHITRPSSDNRTPMSAGENDGLFEKKRQMSVTANQPSQISRNNGFHGPIPDTAAAQLNGEIVKPLTELMEEKMMEITKKRKEMTDLREAEIMEREENLHMRKEMTSMEEEMRDITKVRKLVNEGASISAIREKTQPSQAQPAKSKYIDAKELAKAENPYEDVMSVCGGQTGAMVGKLVSGQKLTPQDGLLAGGELAVAVVGLAGFPMLGLAITFFTAFASSFLGADEGPSLEDQVAEYIQEVMKHFWNEMKGYVQRELVENKYQGNANNLLGITEQMQWIKPMLRDTVTSTPGITEKQTMLSWLLTVQHDLGKRKRDIFHKDCVDREAPSNDCKNWRNHIGNFILSHEFVLVHLNVLGEIAILEPAYADIIGAEMKKLVKEYHILLSSAYEYVRKPELDKKFRPLLDGLSDAAIDKVDVPSCIWGSEDSRLAPCISACALVCYDALTNKGCGGTCYTAIKGANSYNMMGYCTAAFCNAVPKLSIKNLPLKNSWGAYGGVYGSPSYTVSNGICVVDGLIKNGGWGHIATLPAACRPPKRLIFDLNNHAKSARVDVETNGKITWVAGGKDHGWISLSGIVFAIHTVELSLSNGWKTYGGAYGSPGYAMVHGMCVVDGLIKNGGWGHIATLPAACRPPKRLIFDLNNHAKSARVDVETNGKITWVAGGKDHRWISLTGITFALDPFPATVAATVVKAQASGALAVPLPSLPSFSIPSFSVPSYSVYR